jgi:hypothetical protein
VNIAQEVCQTSYKPLDVPAWCKRPCPRFSTRGPSSLSTSPRWTSFIYFHRCVFHIPGPHSESRLLSIDLFSLGASLEHAVTDIPCTSIIFPPMRSHERGSGSVRWLRVQFNYRVWVWRNQKEGGERRKKSVTRFHLMVFDFYGDSIFGDPSSLPIKKEGIMSMIPKFVPSPQSEKCP